MRIERRHRGALRNVVRPGRVCALFSGGHDSLCATHVASQHPSFDGKVHHINTRIGAKRTRQFVEDVCKEFGWELVVHASNFSYEKFVQRLGFPGPGAHQWVYNKIKDRPVSEMAKGCPTVLLTGCRSQESVRRMGHVEPVKVGETSKKTGKVSKKNRIWTAPCHDWSSDEQQSYMAEHDLPRNPVKLAMGMSGECFCGAFAAPGEIERIKAHVPDVAEEIARLTEVAKAAGTHSEWGTRPKGQRKGLVMAETGPLCSSCDIRASNAGIVFEDAA